MAYRNSIVQCNYFSSVSDGTPLIPYPTAGSSYLVGIYGIVTVAGGFSINGGTDIIIVPGTAPVGSSFSYSYGDGLRIGTAVEVSVVDIGGGSASLTVEYYYGN